MRESLERVFRGPTEIYRELDSQSRGVRSRLVLDHRYPAVSVETIRQLARQVNEKMPAHYSHIRVQARRDAISILD